MTVEAQPERPSPREALGRRRRPSVLSIIGLFFVALIVVWLLSGRLPTDGHGDLILWFVAAFLALEAALHARNGWRAA